MATLGTFTAGQVLTAAEMNAIGTWTAFTPSWTNLTVGTGATNSGHYAQLNKILFVKVYVVLGTGPTVGDPIELTLPASLTTAETAGAYLGTAMATDTGVASYPGVCAIQSSTKLRLITGNATGTYLSANTFNTTRPFTWAAGDSLSMDFMVRLS